MSFYTYLYSYLEGLSTWPSPSIEHIASAYFYAILATTLVVILFHTELISKDSSKICLFLIMVLTLSGLFSLSLYEVWRFQRYSQLIYTFFSSPISIATWLLGRFTLSGLGELFSQ